MPDALIQEVEKEFGPRFKEATERMEDLSERLEAASSDEDKKALTESLESLDSKVKTLTAEREEKLREAEFKSMAGQVTNLRKVVEELREPTGFDLGNEGAPGEKAIYARGSDHSFYTDAKGVLTGRDPSALARWQEALGEGKAMTEGTGSAGGFLVPDQISSDLLELRGAQAVLRSLFSSVQVSSDTLRIASVTGGLTAGWVAELAAKPAADLTFGEISTNVFTGAGLAVVSNQLLADSNPSVDTLINRDLAVRLANLEEIAFIAGTGTGQPLGILNTAGVNSRTPADTAILTLLDSIVDGITDIYTNYFAAPDSIVMHPRTWARIIKARESATSATYLVGPPSGGADARRPTDSLPGYGQGALPVGNLFGLNVYTTPNVPTNLGAGTNESRVIVGRFSEGLILDRQGITLDSSEHVYFTTNQTIFRAEERVGFTAGRYPKAFTVIGGTGLANG